MNYRAKIPATFGQLSAVEGLMFTCTACTRATSFDRSELVKRWGEEGAVAALAARLGCSNCRAKRKRRAPLRVEVIGVYISGSEQRRAKLGPVDRLMFDIERLKPGGKVG